MHKRANKTPILVLLSCLAGRRTMGSFAQAPAVSTSCVTLVNAPPMPWTSGPSSAQSTTASRSGAGITNGSPTLKWTVSLSSRNESSRLMGPNYFMDQEAQNVSPFICVCRMYYLPRGCIHPPHASLTAKEKQMVCTVFVKTLSLLKINNIFPGLK